MTTVYEHITFDRSQAPVIVGTTMKVIELVLDKLAYGWSPEELRFQHPELSMGQVYSALAYYSDHQEELDREIDRRLLETDRLKQALAERRHRLIANLRMRAADR